MEARGEEGVAAGELGEGIVVVPVEGGDLREGGREREREREREGEGGREREREREREGGGGRGREGDGSQGRRRG